MGIEELDEDTGKFLAELYKLSKGNTAYSISMYQLGEMLGMDRAAASRTAETLMGSEWVEIKTLSGAIGITAAAVAGLKEQEEKEGSHPSELSALPPTPVIDAPGRASIETLLTQIKYHLHEAGLSFDGMAGVVSDIKTIEAQLTSPSPKTAILRECFVSLKAWMEKTSHPLLKDRIKSILGR
jgi:energy-converting hydrogenase Eha subunit A